MTKPFWKDGIRFECQGSGKCCMSRGEYGYVYLTLEDRRRLAKHLEMPLRQLTQEHLEKTEGLYHLRRPDLDCEFLQGNRCGVYEGRPAQCRTWPFWPENMKARTWKNEVATYCPGIGKGRMYGPDEIRALMKASGQTEGVQE